MKHALNENSVSLNLVHIQIHVLNLNRPHQTPFEIYPLRPSDAYMRR